MKFLKLIPILFIFFGNFPYKNFVHAETNNPKDFKVLSINSKKLSISNVEFYLEEGDKFIENGDFSMVKFVFFEKFSWTCPSTANAKSPCSRDFTFTT